MYIYIYIYLYISIYLYIYTYIYEYTHPSVASPTGAARQVPDPGERGLEPPLPAQHHGQGEGLGFRV